MEKYDCDTCYWNKDGSRDICAKCTAKDRYTPVYARVGQEASNDTWVREIHVSGKETMTSDITVGLNELFEVKDTMKTQSFDSLILECQDALSIDVEIEKRYKRWVRSNFKIPFKFEWNKRFYKFRNVAYTSLLLSLLSAAAITFFDVEVLIYLLAANSITCMAVSTSIFLVYSSELEFKLYKIKRKKPSEQSKYDFMKESYVVTVQNINKKLSAIKLKIISQINEHVKDELQIKEYSDIFGNTNEAIDKIKQAIESLQDSHKKISDKQKEVEQILNDFIGENGYITQKEKELARIKIAQELSDRMKKNFKTTMEINYSVDILNDAIIPGMKKLMSFRLPELIEQAEFECDKSREYLKIAS